MSEGNKKVEKVINGTAKLKDDVGFGALVKSFVAGDIDSVKSYLINDVLIPTLKNAALNTVSIILYGKTEKTNSNSTSRIPYSGFFSQPTQTTQAKNDAQDKSKNYGRNVYFETRGEAERVLGGLLELISDFEAASVLDLYDLAGVSAQYDSFPNAKYGWTNLEGVDVALSSNGYYIRLPKPVLISN